MKNTWRIKKQDWIILRLLFVLMAIDPTMANLGELQKTMAYLKKRYKGRSGDVIQDSFNLLNKEHKELNTFNEPEIMSCRNLMDSVHITRFYKDEEEKEEAQRKFFGTTYVTPDYSSENLIKTLADLEGKKK